MADKKWEKLGALGGIVFVVLNIVGGGVLTGEPPAPDDSGDKIVEFLIDKDSALKAGAVLGGISVLFLVWWFASLWRRMSKAEAGNHRLAIAALVALAASGALFMSSTGVQAAMAQRAGELSADSAAIFYTLSTVLLSTSGFFIATHLLAVNSLSMRTKFLPTWVTYLGLVAGIAFLVASLGVASASGGILFFGFLSFLVWSLWIVVVSVHMWRTAEAT